MDLPGDEGCWMNLATLTRPAPHIFGGPHLPDSISWLPDNFLVWSSLPDTRQGITRNRFVRLCVYTVFDHLDRLFPPTHPGYRNWASKSYGAPEERMEQL